MPLLQIDCPRCGAKSMTADVPVSVGIGNSVRPTHWEVFAVCRKCKKGSIQKVRAASNSLSGIAASMGNFVPHTVNGNLDHLVDIIGGLDSSDFSPADVPEYMSPTVRNAYVEAVSNIRMGCPNAAAAMFRLALDLATKEKVQAIPAADPQPNSDEKRVLAKRVDWLFEQKLLPATLKPLATALRENANDGAHDGVLTMQDANDLYDFAEALMYEIYTVPGQINAINKRRVARRAS